MTCSDGSTRSSSEPTASAPRTTSNASVHHCGATGGRFLPGAASAELVRPQPVAQVAAGEERHWGLGWYLGRPEVQTTYKAGGAFEGVWCWLEAFPASGVCVVLLTNSQSGARATHPIMNELRPFLLHTDQPHASA